MPWYLTRGRSIKPSVLSQNLINAGVDLSTDLCDAYCNTKFIDFIDILTDKLHDVVKKQKVVIDKLTVEANARVGRGVILASIVVKTQIVGVKYEYIEYINRYGPPLDGQFDIIKLNGIRLEFGMPLV